MLDLSTLVVLSERDGKRCLRWKETQLMSATAFVVYIANVFKQSAVECSEEMERCACGNKSGLYMEMEMDSHGGLEITIRQTESEKTNYPTTS